MVLIWGAFNNYANEQEGVDTYRTRAIITRGLYTFYPIFEVQKRFFNELFLKILALCIMQNVCA